MNVFILALDGLEYCLVEKYNLKYLKQTVYGKIEVGKEYTAKYDVPYTPVVWQSFITGKKPEEHGIYSFTTYGRFWDRIRKLPVIRSIKIKAKIAWKIGIKPKAITKNHLRHKTIFDEINPSIAIDVPTYNLVAEDWFLKFKPSHATEELIKTIWESYQKRKEKTFNLINHKEWKLFMTYFRISDLLGHLYFVKHPLKLMNCYLELNQLARQIKDKLRKNTVMLIVSDHGMRASKDGVTGTHSKYAFWSLNIKTDWKPKDITDFYPKILEWAKDH